MKKKLVIILFLLFGISNVFSQSFKNLWTDSEYVSGINHEMVLVYSYDDFEDKKFYNFTDVIQNPTNDIRLIFFHFHWLEKTGLYGITITIDSKEWYFLTGNIAIKFDSNIFRLEGKESSKNNFPSLQTKVFISKLPEDFTETIKNIEDEKNVSLRIYTKEKGYLDIDMPIKFFKKAASITKEEMSVLKEQNGVK